MRTKAKTATILVVENDPLQLSTFGEILRGDGYRVIGTKSADDARKQLEVHQIDLVMIDLRLMNDASAIDFSGIEFARTVDESIPKILLTGHPTVQSAIAALSGGDTSAANDYVFKGEGAFKLLQAVRRWLRPKVFLVHGQDTEVLLSVMDLVKGLGLWPIILKEELAGRGNLVKQFSRYSGVTFAVVIATPDDVGSRNVKPRVQELRQRQTVVFMLGFLFGKLPPGRIVVLKKEPTRLMLPSDVEAITWIELDPHGDWKSILTKVLKQAQVAARR